MQRLAAVVPRPKPHLLRFHGVLALNGRPRPEIIRARRAADPSDAPLSSAPTPIGWGRLPKRRVDIDIEPCPQYGGTVKIVPAIEDAA